MREEQRRSRDEVCGRRGEGAEGEGGRRKEEGGEIREKG